MLIELTTVDAIGDRTLVPVDTPYGRFAIARVEDSYYVFPDSCPHASCPLSDGMLLGSVLTCDCHFSEFDVPTGRVLSEPAETDLVVWKVSPNDTTLSVAPEILASLKGT